MKRGRGLKIPFLDSDNKVIANQILHTLPFSRLRFICTLQLEKFLFWLTTPIATFSCFQLRIEKLISKLTRVYT